MTDLWDDVVAEAATHPDLEVLGAGEAAAVIDRFATRFVADRRATWWWTALADGVEARTIECGDADPFPLIRDLVPNVEVMLVVTDDDADPAGVLRGPLDALVVLLGELPPFEFFLTDDVASFGVFDTHHDTLVHVA